MKVWITRDKINSVLICLWDIKPLKDEDGNFDLTDEMALKESGWAEQYYIPIFKRLFGFTPRKGSCKQYELELKEIK